MIKSHLLCQLSYRGDRRGARSQPRSYFARLTGDGKPIRLRVRSQGGGDWQSRAAEGGGKGAEQVISIRTVSRKRLNPKPEPALRPSHIWFGLGLIAELSLEPASKEFQY